MKIRVLTTATILLSFCRLVPAVEISGPDPRLDEKVTYEAKGEFLSKVIEELTSMTGVSMICGLSETDWQVRECRVTVFVKDMPLKDVQRYIADVVHFDWTSSITDGVRTYRIYQSRKSKNEENAMRKKNDESDAKKKSAQRQNALAELDKLDAIKPEDLEKLKIESPFLYLLAKEPVGEGLRQLLKILPEARSAIADGREVSLDLADAPPEVIDAAMKFVNGMGRIAQLTEPNLSPQFSILADGITNARLMINNGLEDMADPDVPKEQMPLGVIEICDKSDDSLGVNVPIFDFESTMSKVVGLTILKAINQDPAYADFDERSITAALDKAMLAVKQSDKMEEPIPQDPDFEKLVDLEIKGNANFPDLLVEISRKANVQVVADCFDRSPVTVDLKKKGKLGDVLKSISTNCGSRFTKKANVITFVDRKWYKKRAYQIRQDSIDQWHKACKSNIMTLEDIVDMASLTDEQLKHNLLLDEKLVYYAWQALDNRNLLQLYSALTDSQRATLVSKPGISLSTLTKDQLIYVDKLLVGKDDMSEQAMNALVLRMAAEDDKSYRFSLAARAEIGDQSGEFIRSWTVSLPQITGKKMEDADPPSRK
jgi:hypothetical protein